MIALLRARLREDAGRVTGRSGARTAELSATPSRPGARREAANARETSRKGTIRTGATRKAKRSPTRGTAPRPG